MLLPLSNTLPFILGAILGGLLGLWFGSRRQGKQTDFSDLKWPDIHVLLSDDMLAPFYAQEVQHLKKLLKPDPAHLSYLLEASLLRRAHQPLAALKIHQTLLANPALGSDLKDLLRLQLSQDYLRLRQWDKAEETLRGLPRHLQKKPATKFLWAVLYLKTGKEPLANAILKKIKQGEYPKILNSFFDDSQLKSTAEKSF